ncbi:MAG: sigma factor-like helix-turn-helix DNA-binding protein [Gammaproteobacteria bacterium]
MRRSRLRLRPRAVRESGPHACISRSATRCGIGRLALSPVECVQGLPERTAQVFVLREVGGLEAAEICKELAISASNYWVLMHRARLRLRECLQKRWFASHP